MLDILDLDNYIYNYKIFWWKLYFLILFMLGLVLDFKFVFIWEMVSIVMILILELDCEFVFNWEIISLM